MRVALVVMPFAASDCPSLPAGLLKALLQERGISCDCKYFNLTFCSLLGEERYREFTILSPTNVLAGEWIFSQVYFGDAVSSWESYSREILDHRGWRIDEGVRGLIRAAARLAPLFLRIAYESCDWSSYDLVGFTSTFEQTLPGMCLAKMIRRNHPQVKIAFGGANFEGPMAAPYLELFPEVDYISTGEADHSFPQLCENLAQGSDAVPRGILHRNGGSGEAESGPVALEALPFPDYDEFFPAFAKTFPHAEACLTIQASRGCWWGEKRHCTFCGLNGEMMAFRRKSWQRVAEEAAAMEERYRPSALVFADNILAMEYFPTLLRHWSETGNGTSKFFEIKSNLKREHVALLKQARVLFVQPGIESLADRTLGLMDKGVSAAQNVALLRWCQELGVTAHWNILFGLPGEDLDDYARTHEIMQKISHLRAPEVCGTIRVDRFSPHFERWQEMGFTALRPLPSYRHVYPADEASLHRLAYHFEYEHAHSDRVVELARDVIEFGSAWREACSRRENGSLSVKRALDGGWLLVDTRFNRPRAAHRLQPEDRALLLSCDAPTTREALFGRLAGASFPRRTLARAYDGLLRNEALCQLGEKILTIALLPDSFRQAAQEP